MVTWKIENLLNEVGDKAEEISRRRVVHVTWLLLTAYSKMGEERDKLSKERNKLVIIKDLGLTGFKNEIISRSQTLQLENKNAKIKEMASGREHIQGMVMKKGSKDENEGVSLLRPYGSMS